MPIAENISLADLKAFARALIVGGCEQKVAEERARSLDDQAPRFETEAILLSAATSRRWCWGNGCPCARR